MLDINISRNRRSKGLRGIRSLCNLMSIEKCIDTFRKRQPIAEQNQILSSCSRICNVGTIFGIFRVVFCTLGTFIRTSTLIMQVSKNDFT